MSAVKCDMKLAAISESSDRLLLSLDEVQFHHASRVGGKAIGLGNLFSHGFPVPQGFVLTVDAYQRNIGSGFAQRVDQLLQGLDERSDNRAASEKIRDLFLERGFDAGVELAIRTAYAELGEDIPVAVRSSATAEDVADASFAGQQETFLWIVGADAVCRHVLLCWASLFSPQAIGYRARFGVASEGLAMAVVVQRMVDAAAAGVMFTLDPANGERGVAYIESAHGLGEIVVRGEVSPDRFHVNKASRKVKGQIARKQAAYRFDATVGSVRKRELGPDEAIEPSLSQDEAAQLATLGIRVEHTFGRPMDIEWAIDNNRRIQLLQARPETVWSRRPTREEVAAAIGRHDDWDPLNETSEPGVYWTTVNVGEAMPGVMSPLSWTTWEGKGDQMCTEAFHAMGALNRKETVMPPHGYRKHRAFYGRVAIDPTLFITPSDRIPGTSGRRVAEHIIGEAPNDIAYAPTRRRWPIIAVKLPWVMMTTPGRLRRGGAEADTWWRQKIAIVPGLDKQQAIALYAESRLRFYEYTVKQVIALMCLVQPMYQALEKLTAQTGVGSAEVLAGGYGGVPEVRVVHDMWRASRGEISLDEVVRDHGYHGPAEGELSSRSWREDPSPLRKMLLGYAARGNDASPLARDALRRQERLDTAAAIVAATPFWRRPLTRAVLALAARWIPLRGVAKNAFLQYFDVVRAAARRAGECLVAEGVLESADDVFMLTMDELEAGPTKGVAELIERRKKRQAIYQQLTIPTVWRGEATPSFVTDMAPTTTEGEVLTGIGVSAGILEGRARVIMEPDFSEVEAGDILVAPTTDPSWSSIMFISAGLVVDIGGAMSHAAVVARELGIPCVVNCLSGTRAIRNGDWIRLNGGAGTVEILERAAA